MIAFGISDNIFGIFFCRFISGFFSYSQIMTRKFLFNIIEQKKGDWLKQSRNSLWAYKIGIIIGIALTGFLLKTSDFLPSYSKFVQHRFLLPSLIVFLLEVTGILLIFSIDASIIIDIPKKYIELPEVKEEVRIKEFEENRSELQTKEKYEIESYLHASVIGNEHLASEESVGPEEVKFYSPRTNVKQSDASRTINSARPKPPKSFHFSGNSSEARDNPPHEGEGKRTHISFIEDDFENVPEIQQSQPVQSDIPIVKIQPHLTFAFFFRSILSLIISMFVETIPYWILFMNHSINIYIYSAILLLIILLSNILSLLTFDFLLVKISYSSLLSYSLIFLSILIGMIPLFIGFSVPLEGIIFLILLCFINIEILIPAGCIMISDSVPLNLREETLEHSNFYCIATKAIGAVLGPILLSVFGVSSTSFLVCSIVLVGLWWESRKIKKYFPFMAIIPYKL